MGIVENRFRVSQIIKLERKKPNQTKRNNFWKKCKSRSCLYLSHNKFFFPLTLSHKEYFMKLFYMMTFEALSHLPTRACEETRQPKYDTFFFSTPKTDIGIFILHEVVIVLRIQLNKKKFASLSLLQQTYRFN